MLQPGERMAVRGTAMIAALIFCLVVGDPAPAQAKSSSECDAYARNYASQYGGSGQVLTGATRGAVRGTLLGGIFGGSDGWGRGAAIGAGIGAISGGVQRNQDERYLYDRAYNDCMNG